MHMWLIQHKHDILENFKGRTPLNAFSKLKVFSQSQKFALYMVSIV